MQRPSEKTPRPLIYLIFKFEYDLIFSSKVSAVSIRSYRRRKTICPETPGVSEK